MWPPASADPGGRGAVTLDLRCHLLFLGLRKAKLIHHRATELVLRERRGQRTTHPACDVITQQDVGIILVAVAAPNIVHTPCAESLDISEDSGLLDVTAHVVTEHDPGRLEYVANPIIHHR